MEDNGHSVLVEGLPPVCKEMRVQLAKHSIQENKYHVSVVLKINIFEW